MAGSIWRWWCGREKAGRSKRRRSIPVPTIKGRGKSPVFCLCSNYCYFAGMKNIFLILLWVLTAPLFARSQYTATGPAPAESNDKLVDSFSKTFAKVEIESEFPGGAKAWLQFLNEHLVYPKKAVRKRIEGTVVLQFIVDKQGNVSDLQVLSGDPILAEAALKAMADTPKWHPAVQHGHFVKSYKKQPIVFKLVAG